MSDAFPDADPPLPALRVFLGSEPREIKLLGGGGNSRVYRVMDSSGRVFALKSYFQNPGDPRDRLGTEVQALQFLWDQGVRQIPQPLKADSRAQLALFEFVEGSRVDHPLPHHLDEACAFLAEIHRLSNVPAAASLPKASEASVSIDGTLGNIQTRLDRHLDLAEDPEASSTWKSFLKGELVPAWTAVCAECQERCRQAGLSPGEEIPLAERTLSPSDFGFHNALLRNQHLVFLDFEYFGWDDPAKLVSDLLLHPGMDLSMDLRRQFTRAMLTEFAGVRGFQDRIRLVFPLYGIKWCLILLNEFLRDSLQRRTFAAAGPLPVQERQALQLHKARSKLMQTLNENRHFPYFS